MKNIWLVRHCESMANAGYVTADSAGIQLTELGQKQARLLPQSFDKAPNLIVTSPFVRTKQSSIYVREKFSNVPHEEWAVQEFSYLSFKNYANTSTTQRQPAVKEYWDRCDPTYCDGDGAESFLDLINRINITIDKIKERTENFIVIFTHGQFMKTFLWNLKNPKSLQMKSMKSFMSFMNEINIDNGSIFKFKLLENSKWEI